MGNFCTEIHQEQLGEREGGSGNSLASEFEMHGVVRFQLIVGSYRNHRADLLLVFAQVQDLEYSSEIKDYAQNYLELIETANHTSKPIVNVHCNRGCPYKRFVVAILPPYNSQQSDTYYKQFQSMISEILVTCSQIALQVSPTSENGKGVPNQTLIALFVRYLLKYQRPLKIYMMSSELRLLNMVRYEMAKLGTYVPLIKQDKDSD